KLERIVLPIRERIEQQAKGDETSPAAAPGWGSVLERLYGFFSPLEARLSAHAHVPALKFHRRRKSPLMAQDLFDLSGGTFDLAVLPVADAVPDVTQLPQALGALYVLAELTTSTARTNLLSIKPRDLESDGLAYELDQLIMGCASPTADSMMLQTASATQHAFNGWMSKPAPRAIPAAPRVNPYQGFPRIAGYA
ncbi:MAG TPA: hypothetical protein VF669_12410, partial [Tepidisphaeraceae bacterium]